MNEKDCAESVVARQIESPTDAEQLVWMEQIQFPDRILKHVIAFRLNGFPDLARLECAVQRTVTLLPDLVARYRFDETQGLRRFRLIEEAPWVVDLEPSSIEDVLIRVLEEQCRCFDPERHSPFCVRLMAVPQGAILAFLVHDLVARRHDIRDLVRAVIDCHERGGADAPRELTLTSIGGWGRHAGEILAMTDRSVQTFWSGGGRGWSLTDGRICRRGRVRCARTAFGLESSFSNDDVLAVVSALFSLYLLEHIGCRGVIARKENAQPRTAARNWSSPVDPSMLAVRKIGRALPLADLREMFVDAGDECHGMSAMRHGESDDDNRDDVSVLFRWASPMPFSFRVGELMATELTVPSAYHLDGLVVCVECSGADEMVIELIAGSDFSPHANAFLLERFPEWCENRLRRDPGISSKPTGRGRQPVALNFGEQDDSRVLQSILSEFRLALERPDMSADDDFFDAGGHSLVATRIIGRLAERHGLEIAFNDVFRFPSARGLAQVAVPMTAPRPEADGGESRSSVQGAPLSMAQTSLWKAWEAFGFGAVFNIPFALEFHDEVDERVFFAAFHDLLCRHSILRSLFLHNGCEVVQRVVPLDELFRFKFFWTSAEAGDSSRHVEAARVFDLAQELPLRLRFFRNAVTGRQELSMLFHHVVVDEWSVNILMDELLVAYEARASGGSPEFPNKALPFADFAREQASAGLDRSHVAYWVDMLRSGPAPTQFVAPGRKRHQRAADLGEEGGWVEFVLDEGISSQLRRLARLHDTSLFHVAYTAIVIALWRVSGQTRMVVGTSAAARTDPRFFDTVGYFTTVVAHLVNVEPRKSVSGLLAQVTALITGSIPFSDVPIDVVEAELGMSPGRDHLFEVFVQIHARNKLNGSLKGIGGRAIPFRQIDPEKHESMLGLQFEVMDEVVDGRAFVRVLMSYRSSHYDQDDVALLQRTTERVFKRLGAGNVGDCLVQDLL